MIDVIVVECDVSRKSWEVRAFYIHQLDDKRSSKYFLSPRVFILCSVSPRVIILCLEIVASASRQQHHRCPPA